MLKRMVKCKNNTVPPSRDNIIALSQYIYIHIFINIKIWSNYTYSMLINIDPFLKTL